jgi:hypothetical protein
MTRRAARVVTLLAIAGTVVVVLATPAGAHSTSGPPASNFHSDVRGVTPAVPGVRARLGPDGERIELRVTGRARVTVLGYRGEPYLRVSAHGVLENRSSPAVALNRSRVPTGSTASGPLRAPRWVRISSGDTAVWHDHRTHWMGGVTPSAVERAPDRPHVIDRWSVPLRVEGGPGAITGTTVAVPAAIVGSLRWEPPPDALLWWALAVGLGALVLVGVRVAARPTLLGGLVLLAVAESAHLWGAWPFATSNTAGRIGENLPSIAAVASALLALVWLVRRSAYSAAPLLVIAGLFTAVAGGFADLPSLSHAWVPSRLDPGLARTLVAIALGVGVAVAVAGGVRLRRPAEPAAAPPPEPSS